MVTKWFTSDLHLGHKKVSEIRGYLSPVQHDLDVLATLKASVREDDILYVLGDLVGRDTEWRYALGLMAQVPGRKHLILGNHDPAHPGINRRSTGEPLRRALDVFESVAPFGRTNIAGRYIVLSHFPYLTDRDGRTPRYLQWRLRDEGALLLHGHTHMTHRVSGRRQVHVGWDAWAGPVRDADVLPYLKDSYRA